MFGRKDKHYYEKHPMHLPKTLWEKQVKQICNAKTLVGKKRQSITTTTHTHPHTHPHHIMSMPPQWSTDLMPPAVDSQRACPLGLTALATAVVTQNSSHLWRTYRGHALHGSYSVKPTQWPYRHKGECPRGSYSNMPPQRSYRTFVT